MGKKSTSKRGVGRPPADDKVRLHVLLPKHIVEKVREIADVEQRQFSAQLAIELERRLFG